MTLFPKKFEETNPRRKFYKTRLRKWDGILGHRFFSHQFGFFTVKKIWNCYEYCRAALTPDCKSHWFQHYTIEIRTDEGEKLIVRKLPLDLEGCFKEPYDKKKEA